MIEARALTKSFGQTHAVDSVSFEIQPGEIVGFLGPNGAGKTTTMRMLAGLLSPDRGTARIGGFDVGTARNQAQGLLGYMPEACSGFADLTVREFLIFCAECRGLKGTNCTDAIYSVSKATSLLPALDSTIRTLSKGWRQRAWFAQAVLHRPPAVILDEPTDGLDPVQKTHVREFIKDMSQATATILSTHVLEEAETLCTRIVIIAGGTVLADAPIKSLFDRRGRLAPAFAELTTQTDAA